ncbi:MAG TPA: FHA domain-containing protein [Herpetosiphonaceae bacterium]|nr:FHA domain-containing protein [Herpetosiphonaceae bacterium]
MTCPSCGHTNDAGNRFCEYCGARLDPALNQEATVQQMGPPSFGNDASYDAPTMFVPTEEAASSPPAPASSAPEAKEVICGVCGYANQPGDRFCDQCGAALGGQAAPAATPPPAANQAIEPLPDGDDDRTVVGSFSPPDQGAAQSEPAAPAEQSVHDIPTPPGGTPMVTPPAASAGAVPDSLLAEMVMAPVPDDESPTVPTPPDEATTYDQASGPTAPAWKPPTTPSAPASQPEAAPAQAEAAPAQAEPDPAPSAAEPAASAPSGDRSSLESAIQEHRDNLAMFEQMASRYQGRAVPAHITAGLEESRTSLDQAEAELATLQGGSPTLAGTTPPPAAAPAEAELVSSAPPAQAVTAEPTEPAPAPMPTAAEPAPSPTPMPDAQPAGTPAPMPVIKPHLSVDSSGATLDLPTDKPVIVVGREDPISGIYPEVDLTPHGGESGGVSRQHARLLHDGGSWKVEDLNSTNYTKVNGTKIAPNTPTDLNDGDKVNFGRVALTFHKG